MSFDAAKVFRDEADELLADLEQQLLTLESSPDDPECIAKVFRDIHTIKGSGAMFGFDELARFAHDVENVFDKVRSGEITLDSRLLTLTLQAKDHIHLLLAASNPGDDLLERSSELIAAFRSYLEPEPAAGAEPDGAAAQASRPGGGPEPYDPAQARSWVIRYRPSPDTFMSGTDPLGLISELEGLGKLWCVFREGSIPPLEQLDPEKAYGWWDFLLVTDKGLDAIKDVFIFVEDERGPEYGEIQSEPIRGSDVPALTAMIAQGRDLSHQELRDQLAARITNKVSQRAVVREGLPAPGAATHAAASIRVDSSRMDMFVNLVGELVIVQSRLSQAASGSGDPILRSIAEDLQRLAAEMRDQALEIRMIPIGSIYGTLRRLVRDLCGQMGKDVEFIGNGAQTELDKNVIDQLKDPLVHILRNSIDHGVESPEVRAAAGKPPKGSITLDAAHSGGSIVITVTDDGAGIDTARVRAKAVEKGLLSPSDEKSDKELLNLIFAPGFSTAQKVTSVSGRGVGMDVVKKNIESLRGTVEIDTTLGHGTTLSIRLPLTLAIIDGLQVRVGRELYILPLADIEACQERYLAGDPPAVGSMEYRGALIPCVSVRKLLEVPGNQPEYERIIVVSSEGRLTGLAVDAVVGQQQAVIKPLSKELGSARFIAGTTVNGDGGVSLILDAPILIGVALSLSRGQQT
jgi:two-component system chemotaxis sensor kinase CheA